MKLSRILGLVSSAVYAVDTATETKIRLVGGPTVNEGRIEVEHDGEWGTVCDDQYNLNTAHVFCRMLGSDWAFCDFWKIHFCYNF